MIAVAAQFYHVADVDKAVAVDECSRMLADIGMSGAPGSDAERAVDDCHLGAAIVLPDQACGEALTAVVDDKADAGFGRGIGMADRCARECLRQAVEHSLVGDLAGEADIAWRKSRGRAARQELAPMRRRAGNVGNTARRK